MLKDNLNTDEIEHDVAVTHWDAPIAIRGNHARFHPDKPGQVVTFEKQL
ncbi:hypothetical protein ADIS_3803 [Lunatimonas lonarensis]|uniref:Uncharacterized protein n=1 Tax=Lunatimonas lonarensis TaxID=1232681 RepID=R7ZNT0_9BACT|nr:hypothetical protein ADIS_3803 [Lunatimonas lonarensis]